MPHRTLTESEMDAILMDEMEDDGKEAAAAAPPLKKPRVVKSQAKVLNDGRSRVSEGNRSMDGIRFSAHGTLVVLETCDVTYWLTADDLKRVINSHGGIFVDAITNKTAVFILEVEREDAKPRVKDGQVVPTWEGTRKHADMQTQLAGGLDAKGHAVVPMHVMSFPDWMAHYGVEDDCFVEARISCFAVDGIGNHKTRGLVPPGRSRTRNLLTHNPHAQTLPAEHVLALRQSGFPINEEDVKKDGSLVARPKYDGELQQHLAAFKAHRELQQRQQLQQLQQQGAEGAEVRQHHAVTSDSGGCSSSSGGSGGGSSGGSSSRGSSCAGTTTVDDDDDDDDDDSGDDGHGNGIGNGHGHGHGVGSDGGGGGGGGGCIKAGGGDA